MQDQSDAELLRQYAAEKSDEAFGQLVHRYANFVYAAALRQTGSPDAAADTAQSVFIDLARKGPALARSTGHLSLAGWLHRATRYAALNLWREESRRRQHTASLARELEANMDNSPDWTRVAPLLDEAIAALKTDEREALLQRFFQNRDFRAIGRSLGVSDDAAQKRVVRSLEKLRLALERRGVTTTAVALSAALSLSAQQTAPVGAAAGWTVASLAGATSSAGASLTLMKIMSMTKIQLGLGAVVVGALATGLFVQQKSARRLKADNAALLQRLDSLSADNTDLSNRLAAFSSKPDGAPNETAAHELARLRAQVGMLREKTIALSRLEAEKARAEQQDRQQTDAAAAFRQHSVEILNAAKVIGTAFRIYANSHNDAFPTNFESISNELGRVTVFDGNVSLDEFEMVNVGKATDTYPRAIAMRQRESRQAPDGRWLRIYLYCDGSAQQAAGDSSGNFDDWEQRNTDQIPDNPAPAAAAANSQ